MFHLQSFNATKKFHVRNKISLPSVTKLTHLENEEAEFKFKNGPDRNRPMTLIPNLNSCFSTIQKKALLMKMNLRDFAGDEYRDDTHDDDKHET